jgi:hypothetical protein
VCLLPQRLQSRNWLKNNFANFKTNSDVQNSLCTDTTHTPRKHFGLNKTLRYAFTFSYLLKYAPQRRGNYFQNHARKQHSVMDNELGMNHSSTTLGTAKALTHYGNQSQRVFMAWINSTSGIFFIHLSTKDRAEQHTYTGVLTRWISRLYQIINICFLI